MLARKGLQSLGMHLQKHIYSFLTEGNLDLIYLYNRPSSSLSILRRLCKGSKEATQSLQDKFAELRRFLSADPDFKKFYFSVVSRPLKFSREQFLTKDVMLPLFGRMSSAPTQSLIAMLKSVFEECYLWEDCPDQLPENKDDAIENGKFELRKFYVRLGELRQHHLLRLSDPTVASLSDLRRQFKFLLFEQITYLLFKSDVKDVKESHPVIGVRTEVPAFVATANQDCWTIKCILMSCVLPLIITAATASAFPNSETRNVIIGVSLAFALFCVLTSCVGYRERRDNLHRNELSQRFRTGFLDRLDQRYAALNRNENVVFESKDSAAARDVQHSEVMIDISLSPREHQSSGLRAPLLSNQM